jgi:hypothetical protein
MTEVIGLFIAAVHRYLDVYGNPLTEFNEPVVSLGKVPEMR